MKEPKLRVGMYKGAHHGFLTIESERLTISRLLDRGTIKKLMADLKKVDERLSKLKGSAK